MDCLKCGTPVDSLDSCPECGTDIKKVSKVQEILDWAYDKVVNGRLQPLPGFPGFESVIEMAEDYQKKHPNDINKQVDSLIKWYVAKCSAAGFMAGLPGVLALPVTLPAELATVCYLQIKMVAAIAHIGGYDLKSDQVKTFVYMCLVGSSVQNILSDVGIKIGEKFVINKVFPLITGKMLTKINQAVGFKLLTKFGEKGVINLIKCLPLAGGGVSAVIDGVWTNAVGKAAKKCFINSNVMVGGVMVGGVDDGVYVRGG